MLRTTDGCDIESLCVAALWEGILTCLRVGNRSFWGSGRPPGAPETLPKGGGQSPPPFGGLSKTPGAARTSKTDDSRPAPKSRKIENDDTGVRNKFPSKAYSCIGFGVMNVTKLSKFIWFGDILDPKPCNSGGVDAPLFRRHRQCFRAENRSSEPDFGRILVGKASTSALRPAAGPILRLSRIESCPEALLRNIEYAVLRLRGRPGRSKFERKP